LTMHCLKYAVKMDTINEKLCLHDELCKCLKDAIPMIQDLVSKSKHLSRQILVTKKLSSEFFRSLENVMEHLEASSGITDESFQRIFQWGRSLGSIMSNISEALMDVVDTTLTDKVEKLKLTVQQQKMDKKFIDVCSKRIRKNEKYARKLKKNKAKKSKSGVACFNENVEISLNHQMTTFKDYMSDLLDRKNKVRQDSCNSIKDSVYGIFEQLSLFNVALDGLEEGFSRSSKIPESVDCIANNEAFSVTEDNTVEDMENLEDPEIDERTYTINDEDFTFLRRDPFTGDVVFKECLTTRELIECNANNEAFSVNEESSVGTMENLEDTEIDERTYTINDEDFIFVRRDPFTGDVVFKECLTTRELIECNANNEAFSVNEESSVGTMENLEDTEIDERTYTINDEDFTFLRRDPFTGDVVYMECLTNGELIECYANNEAFSVNEESSVEAMENFEYPEFDEQKYRINDGDFSFRRKNPFKCVKMFMEYLKIINLKKCNANNETFSVIDESPVETMENFEYPEIDEKTYDEDSILAEVVQLERLIMYWKYLKMKKNHASFGDSGFQLLDPSLNESSELDGSVFIDDSWKTDNFSTWNYYEDRRTFSDIYENTRSDDIFKGYANDGSDFEGNGDCSLISSDPSTSIRLRDYKNDFSSELAMRSEMTRGENNSPFVTEEREGKD
ncbi:hypothetical protein T11_7504, partial [Trichinella zimbabwensis]